MKRNSQTYPLVFIVALFSVDACVAGDSPEVHDDARVTFRVVAPKADKVLLLGDWLKRGEELAMTKNYDGAWTATAGPFPPGNHIYGFEIDGVQVPDPENSSVKLRASRAGSFFHIPGDALWQPDDVPHGNVDINFHLSKTLGDTRWFSVYTPPDYHKQPNAKYPVLYLLHGSNDTAIGWVMIGAANFIMDNLIANGSAKEMIVVMPFGHAVPHGSPPEIQRTNTQKFESYLLGDIIPLVESKYRVLTSQRDRAIAGLSMGGGQAITIGLQNLDKFCAIGSFSGAVPQSESDRIAEILKGSANVNKGLDLFWIGCGRDDFLLDRNEVFAKMLKDNDIEHELQLTDGVHNYDVWRRNLATLAPKLFQATVPPPGATGNEASKIVTFTTQEDHRNMQQQLGITKLRPGPSGNESAPNHANYDESLANPHPNLPDVMTLKSGIKVTTPDMWWKQRRPEIIEDFEREVLGRVPKNVPGVTWELVGTEEKTLGETVVMQQQLNGKVDNSARPEIEVIISMVVVTPKEAKGKVPVLMMFGFTGFEPGAGRFRGRFGGRGFGGPGAEPPTTQQLVERGWGYATISPTTIQADHGAGLTRGIIGLTNQGQPRKPEDWGSLRAWAWGASRGFDYLETDKNVDTSRVGIDGVSRYGKAALVTMAVDQRFAMVLVGSSGEGGASLYRRNFGEAVENLTGSGEYHWMAGNFLKYGTEESSFGSRNASDLPVDAHQLIALCAPRLTFISYGIPERGDANWLDHQGSFMAAIAAQPVFRLLGARDLARSDDYKTEKMPAVNVDMLDGELAWRQHDGGHTDLPNIKHFVKWADRLFAESPGIH